MSALSFQEIVKIGDGKAVMLCRGKNDAGKLFFHYIEADRKHIEQMHCDYAENKNVDFSGYGEILHSGWGENPSEEDEHVINGIIHKK